MSGIQQLLLGGSPAGYQIERSLRFNSADSAYLNRTFGTSTNQYIFTYSAWVKLARAVEATTNYGSLLSGYAASSDTGFAEFHFYNGTLRFGGWATNWRVTTQVFRDPSSWYHVILAVDTTQATAANRVKMYVNGSEITAFSTNNNPTQNSTVGINNNSTTGRIGQDAPASSTRLFDGYMTEINFIDGQALTPSSFGETDSATGVWKPKKFSGTYGTNGFYLNFSDNSNTTAATLGKDSSGNGNNWTPNNFSVTAGAGNDSLVDTPTSYGTDTGAGGEVRGNYSTLNPLWPRYNTSGSFSQGNLQYTGTGAAGDATYTFVKSTIAIPANSTGKWYWETQIAATTARVSPGIVGSNFPGGQYGTFSSSLTGNYAGAGPQNGVFYKDGASVLTGQTGGGTLNDYAMFAYDASTGELWYGVNGAWWNSGVPASGTGEVTTLSTTLDWFPAAFVQSSGDSITFNFGQRPFQYTAPSGFKALCTQNLPTPTIGATSTTQANDYMNIVLYTGNGGTSQSITGVGFQPDFVWIKKRSGAEQHEVQDAVRGATKRLASNLTDAETTVSSSIVSFNSDGFTVGNAGSTGENGFTYVGWNWNAGGSNATNTSGTITSTVRANTTAGFSIVTYTGNGTTGTVGHGLGVTPSMIIVKSRSTAQRWTVFHTSTSNAYIYLNETFAADTANANVRFGNNTSVVQPTSTLFTIGNSVDVNQSTTTYVAYCFAAVAGYSAFGSYTGNGSADGPFVFLNFRPAFVMLKRSDSTSNWTILDFKRAGYNVDNDQLYPNLSNAEATTDLADLLSNGFKLRSTDTSVNASGGTYIYAAFAENPFKYSLAR